MIVRAKESFRIPGRQFIAEGSLFDSEHPLVQSRAALFEPVEMGDAVIEDSVVESATAAPGEKRSTSRPKKSDSAD